MSTFFFVCEKIHWQYGGKIPKVHRIISWGRICGTYSKESWRGPSGPFPQPEHSVSGIKLYDKGRYLGHLIPDAICSGE